MCQDITVSIGVGVGDVESSRDGDHDRLVEFHAGVLDDGHLAFPPLPLLLLLLALRLVEVLLDVADVLLHVVAALDLDAGLVPLMRDHRHLGDVHLLLVLLHHGVVGTSYGELGELGGVADMKGQDGGALPRVVAGWP